MVTGQIAFVTYIQIYLFWDIFLYTRKKRIRFFWIKASLQKLYIHFIRLISGKINIENYVNKGVVVDKENKLITGQGPAFCMEFALAILEELKGKAVADEVRSGMLLTK